MKLRRLWIDRFKNLRNCEVAFEQPYLLNVAIGGNGSGKSNIVGLELNNANKSTRPKNDQGTPIGKYAVDGLRTR